MADTSIDEDGDTVVAEKAEAENIPETRKSLQFSSEEKAAIAAFIHRQYMQRKDDRKDEELRWDEVDRELRMDPEPRKDVQTGNPVGTGMSSWMPNLELHTQAQAHEALTADARRLTFPNDKSWYTAHALLTDEYLARAENFSFIPGDEQETKPAGFNQEDADMVVEAAIENWHGMYPFRQHIDQIYGQSYSYGTGVARVRMIRGNAGISEYRGGKNPSRLYPCVVPRSIRDTYLDDSPSAVMREGVMVAPLEIEFSRLRLADLKLAASMGSTDVMDERGGWQRDVLYPLEDSEVDPFVDVIDFEGDLMIPVGGTPGVFAPNMVGRVVVNKAGPALIRYAKREFDFNSYLKFPYHRVFMGNAYAVSPLILGSPLHKSATVALNTLMAVAALNAGPPVQYDPNDQFMMATGGPQIRPNAVWKGQSKIIVHQIGDPIGMQQVFGILTKGHEDVTGVNATRLGAQTKSHQTAFAVDSEIGRGLVRTVDFVNDMMDNPFQAMLRMEYEMCKTAYKPKPEAVFAFRRRMWLNIASTILPDQVVFETHGSSGPLEDREREQKQMTALQMIMQMVPMLVQLKAQGVQVDLPDFNQIQRSILTKGGFNDVDSLFGPANKPAAAPPPASPAAPPGGPGAAGTAAPAQPDSAAKIIAMATGQPVG